MFHRKLFLSSKLPVPPPAKKARPPLSDKDVAPRKVRLPVSEATLHVPEFQLKMSTIPEKAPVETKNK
jgi:hypothetical protein